MTPSDDEQRERPGPDFSGLMELYAENFRQLALLVDDHDLSHDRYRSRVPGELPLYVEILERHRYTTVARLTYVIETGDVLSLDPDAHIRIYHDAGVAEATHCYPGQVNQPLFGALVPVSDVYEHRWRVNRFLDRWLEYLLQRGHGLNTLRPCPPGAWPLDGEGAAAGSEAAAAPAPAAEGRGSVEDAGEGE